MTAGGIVGADVTSTASGKNMSCDAGFYRANRGNGIRAV